MQKVVIKRQRRTPISFLSVYVLLAAGSFSPEVSCLLVRGFASRFLEDFWNSHSGLLIARPWCFSREGQKMRTFADTEVQARLIREMRELYEKRGKLEAGIRAVDTARSLRIEKDALVDIAAYRALLSRPQAM
jgi:hypothetical protein